MIFVWLNSPVKNAMWGDLIEQVVEIVGISDMYLKTQKQK